MNDMDRLVEDWKQHRKKLAEMENELIDTHMSFLRRIARHYLDKGHKVYFERMSYCHWGECGFGDLYVAADTDNDIPQEFWSFVFQKDKDFDIRRERHLVEITPENLDAIEYGRSEFDLGLK